MSSFSFCVLSCLVLVVSVQSYVVRKEHLISFVDSADPSKGWTLEKDIGWLDEATLINSNNLSYEEETEDRVAIDTGNNNCAIGYKRAGPKCILDEDYEDGAETEQRIGIAGGFNKCPEGYKRAGTVCVPHDSVSKEELSAAMPLEVARTEINRCPAGFKKAGPACVRDEDYESYEDES